MYVHILSTSKTLRITDPFIMWGIHLSVDGWALIYIVKRLMKWEPSIYQYVILRFVFSHKALSTFRSSQSQPISLSKRDIQNEDGDEIETFHQNVWRFLCVQKSAKDQQPQRKIYNKKWMHKNERPNMIMIAQMTIYGISLHKFDNIIKWPGHESDHPINMIFTLHGNTLNSRPW